jgi:hypothetical protein
MGSSRARDASLRSKDNSIEGGSSEINLNDRCWACAIINTARSVVPAQAGTQGGAGA